MSLSRFLPLSVCLFISTAVLAQPLADRLPASTLLYSGWSPDAAAKSTQAARMLADERLIQPWRMVMQKLVLPMSDDLIGGGAKPSDHFPKLIADAAQCEGCFALLEFKPDAGGITPQAVLILNLGARRADFEEHFKPIHAKLKERLGDRLHMVKFGASWLWMKSTREKPEFTWGFLGDTFVFYFGDQAEKFLPSLSTQLSNSLKDAPVFVDCMSKLPGDSLLTTYIDLRKSLGLAHTVIKSTNDEGLRLLSANWQPILGQIGLDNVLCLGEKTSVRGGQFVTRSLLRTDGPPHGLMASLVQPSVDDAMLKVVPMDATCVAAMRLDLAKFYEQFKTAVIGVTGEDGRRAFGDIEDSAAGFGVPVGTLLGPLGDQWVVYEAASTGGLLFTGLTLVVDVKDPDKFERVIATLQQLLAGPANNGAPMLGSYDAEGVSIQYLQATGGFSLFTLFTPAWAVADKKLVIALYPQVVEDAIRQFRADKSILDNPRFAEVLKQTGGGGPLLFVSGLELVRSVYPFALPFVSAARDMGAPDGGGAQSPPQAQLLPSLQRLLQYVGSDGVSVKVTPDGILSTKSVANPLLSPLTVTDAIPLWVAVALPSMGSAKVTADRARSAGNLRQIWQRMVLYANENQGKLPPDLATVLKTQDLKKETIQSPFGDGKETGDYKYSFVEGMTNATPADIVLIYDASELEKGDGANVLYGDGHVEWLEREGVTAALAKAAKWRSELTPRGK